MPKKRNIKKEEWKKETARDILALGSLIFYLLVIIRATVGPYFIFLYQLLIALGILFLISAVKYDYDINIARGLVLAFLTSIFYKRIQFTIFVSALFMVMIFSSIYIKRDKKKIMKGIVAGIISLIFAYYLAPLIPIF